MKNETFSVYSAKKGEIKVLLLIHIPLRLTSASAEEPIEDKETYDQTH